MTTPADRLRQLRIKRGFSTAVAAARAFGWGEDAYKSHENGQRGIKTPVARKYASAFNSTAAYILTGSGGGEREIVAQVLSVPLIARVSAGAFRYDDGIEEGTIEVPAVPRGDIAAADQYSVLIDGPSVNRRIPDGAYAICAPFDRHPGGAQHGKLVHVVRERAGLHEHTIKEIRYTQDGPILVPCSTDAKHQETIEIFAPEEGTIVRVVGVVIGIFIPA